MGMGDFMDDIGDFLQELVIDYGTIATILSTLEDGRVDLPDNTVVREVPDHVFSTLPAGVQMATHTRGAQEFMLDSFKEMMTTLGLYDEGVKAYRDGSTTTDEFSAEQLDKIRQAAAQGGSAAGTGGNS